MVVKFCKEKSWQREQMTVDKDAKGDYNVGIDNTTNEEGKKWIKMKLVYMNS